MNLSPSSPMDYSCRDVLMKKKAHIQQQSMSHTFMSHQPSYSSLSTIPEKNILQSISDKSVCAICGDKASGKHYGAYSCEGCKGFFKRTVRKCLNYTCRDEKMCIVDKRQRNRCQYCRYQMCLARGMRRESVQEERRRNNQRIKMESTYSEYNTDELPSSSSENVLVTVNDILCADAYIERLSPDDLKAFLPPELQADIPLEKLNTLDGMSFANEKQSWLLALWTKKVPFFAQLTLSDQILLLSHAWNELIIMNICRASLSYPGKLVLLNGCHIDEQNAFDSGVNVLYKRILVDVLEKFQEMNVDNKEFSCLRSIVLFNPDIRGLDMRREIEKLRDHLYCILDEYCRASHPTDNSRFAKLLLRLPVIRSISLVCYENNPFVNMIVPRPELYSLAQIVQRLAL